MFREKFEKMKTNLTENAYKMYFKYNRIMMLGLTVFVASEALSSFAHAGDLFGKASEMVSDVQGQLAGMSTAAAGVGVGTGALMKKFSMGKQDRIETGNKVIRDSLIGWGTINGVPLAIQYIGKYTGGG